MLSRLIAGVSLLLMLGLGFIGGVVWQAGGPERGGAGIASGPALTLQPLSTAAGMREILDLLAPERRQAVLAEDDSFARFVMQELDRQAILAAISSQDVDISPRLQLLQQRAAESVLIEVFMDKLVARNLPAGFPDETTLKTAWESRKEQLEQRNLIPVSQIFVAFDTEFDTGEYNLFEAMDALGKSIRAGEISFEQAAYRYSQHHSRSAGGSLGIQDTEQLLPVIRDALLSLPVGEVSDPVVSEQGLHILRRGDAVTAQIASLEDSAVELAEELRSQAADTTRRAIIERLRQDYATQPPAQELAQWRTELVQHYAKN